MSALDNVRALIADEDAGNQLLTNGQLAAFLELNSQNVWLAAADALEVIAISETLVGKRIRTQDLSTDGVAVSQELRAIAASYRRKAAEQAAADSGDDFGVHIIDTQPTPPRGPELAGDYYTYGV